MLDVRARRLLDRPDSPEPADAPGLWIPAALENGDSADLRWLFATFGREAVARWLAERGGRQLSRRSRCFWERVLERRAGPPTAVAEALWPL